MTPYASFYGGVVSELHSATSSAPLSLLPSSSLDEFLWAATTPSIPLQVGTPAVVVPSQDGPLPGGATLPSQDGASPPTTFDFNQTLVNTGCNFGTVHNDTMIAVEQIVQVAEFRHAQTVVNLAESATYEHRQRVVELTRDAANALLRLAADAAAQAENMANHHAAQRAASDAAHFSRVSQLETALEMMEHQNAQKDRERDEAIARAALAVRTPSRSTPGSADFNDALSMSTSLHSQQGVLASLAMPPNPFAGAFGSKPGPPSQETADVDTTARGGSQSSTTHAYPIDLFAMHKQAFPSQDGTPPVEALGRTVTQTQTVLNTAQTQNDGEDNDPTPHTNRALPSQDRAPNRHSQPQGGGGGNGDDGDDEGEG